MRALDVLNTKREAFKSTPKNSPKNSPLPVRSSLSK
jgi:hypothetical protein